MDAASNKEKGKSLEDLLSDAQKGNNEALSRLAEILISYARGIAYNTKKSCTFYLDFDELIGLAHECFMKLVLSYKPGNKRVLGYFLTIYVREIARYKHKKQSELLLAGPYLDSTPNNFDNESYHELLGSNEEDPCRFMPLSEARLILSDSDHYTKTREINQKYAIILLINGYSVAEICKFTNLSESSLRRLLKNKDKGMPLYDLSIKLGKDK